MSYHQLLVLRKTGYSFTDIQKSIKSAAHARRQRNETIESLSHQRFDEAMESIGRKVNKLLRRNKKKKNKRNKNKKQARNDIDKKSDVLDDDLFNSRGFPKSVGFIRKTSTKQKNHSFLDNDENKVTQSRNLSNVQQKSKDLDFPLHRRDSAQFQDEL